MGSICGRFSRPWDCDFVYRFFIWHDPTAPFKIKKIAVEFCDREGENLFPSNYSREKQEISEGYVEEDYESLLLKMKGSNIDFFSLNQALRKYELTPDIFWEVENYEHPPLINPSLKKCGCDPNRPLGKLYAWQAYRKKPVSQTSVLSVVLKHEIPKGLNKSLFQDRFLYQPTAKPEPWVNRVQTLLEQHLY